MLTPAETLARARTEIAVQRPDLDPDPLLAVLSPRISADGRVRRVDGRVIAVPDAVALLITAHDAEAAPPAAPRSTSPSPVDLVAYRRDLVALRAREAAEPRSVDQVLARLAHPLDKIRSGR
jgi:hypothetical protein